MTAHAKDWRRWYALAQCESQPEKQKHLLEQARRLMQQRSVDMAADNACNAAEDEELNAALRELWKLQNLS